MLMLRSDVTPSDKSTTQGSYADGAISGCKVTANRLLVINLEQQSQTKKKSEEDTSLQKHVQTYYLQSQTM